MQAAKLRHRITIETLVPVQNTTTGAVVDTWTTFATVWASIEPLSVREFIAAQATQSKVSARITLRHLAGVLPSMRVVHGSTVYNIEGVLPDKKSGKEMMTLPVSQVVYG